MCFDLSFVERGLVVQFLGLALAHVLAIPFVRCIARSSYTDSLLLAVEQIPSVACVLLDPQRNCFA
jgi:hypothetical protein